MESHTGRPPKKAKLFFDRTRYDLDPTRDTHLTSRNDMQNPQTLPNPNIFPGIQHSVANWPQPNGASINQQPYHAPFSASHVPHNSLPVPTPNFTSHHTLSSWTTLQFSAYGPSGQFHYAPMSYFNPSQTLVASAQPTTSSLSGLSGGYLAPSLPHLNPMPGSQQSGQPLPVFVDLTEPPEQESAPTQHSAPSYYSTADLTSTTQLQGRLQAPQLSPESDDFGMAFALQARFLAESGVDSEEYLNAMFASDKERDNTKRDTQEHANFGDINLASSKAQVNKSVYQGQSSQSHQLESPLLSDNFDPPRVQIDLSKASMELDGFNQRQAQITCRNCGSNLLCSIEASTETLVRSWMDSSALTAPICTCLTCFAKVCCGCGDSASQATDALKSTSNRTNWCCRDSRLLASKLLLYDSESTMSKDGAATHKGSTGDSSDPSRKTGLSSPGLTSKQRLKNFCNLKKTWKKSSSRQNASMETTQSQVPSGTTLSEQVLQSPITSNPPTADSIVGNIHSLAPKPSNWKQLSTNGSTFPSSTKNPLYQTAAGDGGQSWAPPIPPLMTGYLGNTSAFGTNHTPKPAVITQQGSVSSGFPKGVSPAGFGHPNHLDGISTLAQPRLPGSLVSWPDTKMYHSLDPSALNPTLHSPYGSHSAAPGVPGPATLHAPPPAPLPTGVWPMMPPHSHLYDQMKPFTPHETGASGSPWLAYDIDAESSSSSSASRSKLPKGTGYGDSSGGHRMSRNRGSQSQHHKSERLRKERKTKDDFSSKVIELLCEVLPSLKRESDFDLDPPQALLVLLLKCPVLEEMAELLRNDSIADATTRTDLYLNLFRLMTKLASHPATLHSVLAVRPKTSTKKDVMDESSEKPSMAACMTNLVRQSKLIMRRVHTDADTLQSDEGDMLGLCVAIINLSELLRPHFNTSENTVAAADPATAAKNKEGWLKWHRECCVLDVPNDVMFATYHYCTTAKSLKQGARGRMKRLVEEAANLTTSLPEGIFMRYAESRPDVMKVLIIGPEGTPYENGAFEFDIWCPVNYPLEPPQFHFQTTARGQGRFNPNLYEDGKVCLSLLNTWTGERWKPTESTLLQVLVSLQAMVFCEQPYYNEPGFENHVSRSEAERYNNRVRGMTVRLAMLDWLRGNKQTIWSTILQTHFARHTEDIKARLQQWKTTSKPPPFTDKEEAELISALQGLGKDQSTSVLDHSDAAATAGARM